MTTKPHHPVTNDRLSPKLTIGQCSVLGFLLCWQSALVAILLLAESDNPKAGVMAKMLLGLVLLWVIGMGAISISMRERIAAFGKSLSCNRIPIFFSLVVTMALVEEAIATAMTNCAPFFGAKIGGVYITASSSLLDVVLFHSVVVFLPQFLVWGLALKRYSMSPFAVFLCYGLTGWLNEALSFGPNPLMLAQWILVYGLMVYLPAHLFVSCENRKPPSWWLFPAMVVAPVLCSFPVVAVLLLVIAPGHPSIHFPPM
ncbi:MAG: hypothetical protein ACYTGH_06750 [Planctomycetota bacterium]|jgi:hypothetical protein